MVAELYFEAVTDPEAQRIEAWLKKRPEVTAILPVWKAETRLSSWPAEVIGFKITPRIESISTLLSAAVDVWTACGGAAPYS